MKKILSIAFLVSGMFGSFAFASPSGYDMLDNQLADSQLASDYEGVVTVIGTFRVKQGLLDQLKAIAPQVIQSHRQDDTIIKFRLAQSLTDSQVYVFYAQFGSIRGLKVHMKQMHGSQSGQKLMDLMEKDSLKITLLRQVKI